MTDVGPADPAAAGLSVILEAYAAHRCEFDRITARAGTHFASRRWREMQADATRRLGSYRAAIDRLEEAVAAAMGGRTGDRLVWAEMKRRLAAELAGRHDAPLAATFFNSITRRLFDTVGVARDVEFVSGEAPPREGSGDPVSLPIPSAPAPELVGKIIASVSPGVAFEDPVRDALLVGERIAGAIPPGPVAAEMAVKPFYRGLGAYLVGRLLPEDGPALPIVLAVGNHPEGARVEAVLLDEQDVSILFSYTRSYFHVETEDPAALVEFLSGLLPRKRRAELWISIGFDKHGKTELYGDLIGFLESSGERFERAPGVPGMVMVAFGMPSQDLVFKVIRDSFPAPKQTTRRAVMERYRLVFGHDRAGRLIDAWEFEHLELDRDRFEPGLLDELLSTAGRSVEAVGSRVVLHHAYVERRVTPLDVYVRTRPSQQAAAALIDMGDAVRDLALSGIFPGDMLVKNFGVTRSGRVVFYDYDELALLTTVKFRRIPEPEHPEDEMRSGPTWGAGPADVFPEEFRSFLGLPEPLREIFETVHADLFDPITWHRIQDLVRRGEPVEIPPYAPQRRLDTTR